jgi:hypothetical protein
MSDPQFVTFRFHKPEPAIEPAIGSVVLDDAGDAWQLRDDGWHCAIDGDDYSLFPWDRVQRLCGPTTLIYDSSKEPA